MMKAKKKTLVYCGPDIPRVVKQYSVFTGGLPDRLTQLADEIPSIRALIVSVKDVAEMRMELQTPGSAKYNIFKKAKKEIEKGVW